MIDFTNGIRYTLLERKITNKPQQTQELKSNSVEREFF